MIRENCCVRTLKSWLKLSIAPNESANSCTSPEGHKVIPLGLDERGHSINIAEVVERQNRADYFSPPRLGGASA